MDFSDFEMFFSKNKKKKQKDIVIDEINIVECFNRRRDELNAHLSYISYLREEAKEADIMLQKDNKVLSDLFSTLNQGQVDFIKNEIEECHSFNFSIIDKIPENIPLEYSKDEENPNSFDLYIKQWSSYPCEDCFEGIAFLVIIPNEKVLSWHYSC